MFQRCMLEREKKLKEVRNTIAQSKKQSLPVRTTKLAYVDSSFVKPPRQVRMYFFFMEVHRKKEKDVFFVFIFFDLPIAFDRVPTAERRDLEM